LKQLGIRYKGLNKNEQIGLIDANGKPLGVIGTVELPIGVGDVTLTHTFYVVRGLYLKALLGFDFLRENAAQIDTPNRRVVFNGQTAATTLFKGHDATLALGDSVIIPPFSEANVTLKFIGPYRCQTSIVQPLPSICLRNIAVARAVVQPTNSITTTSILNPSSKYVRFRRNTKIGFISPLDREEYQVGAATSHDVEMDLVEASTHKIQTCKAPHRLTKAKLHPLPIAQVGERWSMDHVLITRSAKFPYLLTLFENTTLWVEAFPCRSTGAQEVAHILVNELFPRHGVCKILLSDRGVAFRSDFVKYLCSLLNVRQIFTSPHRPQTDGLYEKPNSNLITGIRLPCDNPNDYVDYLPKVLWALRVNYSEALKCSPAVAMYGREMPYPDHLSLVGDQPISRDDYANTQIKRMAKVAETIKANAQTNDLESKHRYDRSANERIFDVGITSYTFKCSNVQLFGPPTKRVFEIG
jgi:hypothetical protein